MTILELLNTGNIFVYGLLCCSLHSDVAISTKISKREEAIVQQFRNSDCVPKAYEGERNFRAMSYTRCWSTFLLFFCLLTNYSLSFSCSHLIALCIPLSLFIAVLGSNSTISSTSTNLLYTFDFRSL